VKPLYLSKMLGANGLSFALLCICPWYRRIVAENPVAALGIAHGVNIVLRFATHKRLALR
jgi:hypothetical protein